MRGKEAVNVLCSAHHACCDQGHGINLVDDFQRRVECTLCDGGGMWDSKALLTKLCDTALTFETSGVACCIRRGTRIAVQMAQKALYSRVKADMRVMGWPNGSGHATRREREFR